MERKWTEEELLRCSGSRSFAKGMAAASPFPDLPNALRYARHLWLNHVDVNGWLESFAAHPAIGSTSPSASKWSKEEQSAAMATATDSSLQDLVEWNAKYREKFGFVFLICASGRGTLEILAELKKRYANRPIVELEIAAQEDLKIIGLRLAKLFHAEGTAEAEASMELRASRPSKPEGSKQLSQRTRPPITTHVLDVARGSPASDMEIHLEMWKDTRQSPSFIDRDYPGWVVLGSSVTNSDGRSSPLMDIVDYITPGFYRISFNTGKYAPSGFYPYVSIVFEIKDDQKSEHFHVPLLHSPFSFTTYRGS